MNRPDAEPIEVEIVSPGGKNSSPATKSDPLFALLAKLMDDFFQIPGTKIRFGLDPLIGLIPVLGDGSGAIVSALLIWRGAKAGLPRIVLARMALNVLINTLGGAIPVIGEVFTVWFKSNRMNYALYEKHIGNASASTKTNWFFVGGLLVILLLLVGFVITLSLMLFAALWKFLTH